MSLIKVEGEQTGAELPQPFKQWSRIIGTGSFKAKPQKQWVEEGLYHISYAVLTFVRSRLGLRVIYSLSKQASGHESQVWRGHTAQSIWFYSDGERNRLAIITENPPWTLATAEQTSIRILNIQQRWMHASVFSSTIYELINPKSKYFDATFPKQLNLTTNRVGWWLKRSMTAGVCDCSKVNWNERYPLYRCCCITIGGAYAFLMGERSDSDTYLPEERTGPATQQRQGF